MRFRFGSTISGQRTGVIFNDHLKGFYWKARRGREVKASLANIVAPGKRPMSSSSPLIVVNSNGSVSMVIGCSGGLWIMPAVAYVSWRRSFGWPY